MDFDFSQIEDFPVEQDVPAMEQQGEQLSPPSPIPPTPEIEDKRVAEGISRLREMVSTPIQIFSPEVRAVLGDTRRKEGASPRQPDPSARALRDSDLSKYDSLEDMDMGDIDKDPFGFAANFDEKQLKRLESIKKDSPNNPVFDRDMTQAFRVDPAMQLSVISDDNMEIAKGLMFAESSFGKNRVHAWAGQSRALSSFGLLPTQSMQEVINLGKTTRFAQEYPEEFEEAKKLADKKDWLSLGKMTLTNPDIDAVIADDFINHTKRRIGYETLPESWRDDFLALAWYRGVGGARQFMKKHGIQGVMNTRHVENFNIGRSKELN
jgi:hypothetical protein